MKKLLFIAIAGICSLYAQQKTFTNAVEYNDYIVDELDKTVTAWDLCMDAATKVESLAWADSLAARSGNSLKKLSKLTPYKGYKTFQTAATDYLSFMNKIAKQDLVTFINLIYTEDFNDDVAKKAEAMLPTLDGERERLFTLVKDAQVAFAEKFGFTISSDD